MDLLVIYLMIAFVWTCLVEDLQGQLIVCENNKADWMEFEPLISYYGQNKSSNEYVYLDKGE